METFWQAHFYRQTYGDVGFGPLPFLPGEYEDAEVRLSEQLLWRHACPKPRHKVPLTADMVDN